MLLRRIQTDSPYGNQKQKNRFKNYDTFIKTHG